MRYRIMPSAPTPPWAALSAGWGRLGEPLGAAALLLAHAYLGKGGRRIGYHRAPIPSAPAPVGGSLPGGVDWRAAYARELSFFVTPRAASAGVELPAVTPLLPTPLAAMLPWRRRQQFPHPPLGFHRIAAGVLHGFFTHALSLRPIGRRPGAFRSQRLRRIAPAAFLGVKWCSDAFQVPLRIAPTRLVHPGRPDLSAAGHNSGRCNPRGRRCNASGQCSRGRATRPRSRDNRRTTGAGRARRLCPATGVSALDRACPFSPPLEPLLAPRAVQLAGHGWLPPGLVAGHAVDRGHCRLPFCGSADQAGSARRAELPQPRGPRMVTQDARRLPRHCSLPASVPFASYRPSRCLSRRIRMRRRPASAFLGAWSMFDTPGTGLGDGRGVGCRLGGRGLLWRGQRGGGDSHGGRASGLGFFSGNLRGSSPTFFRASGALSLCRHCYGLVRLLDFRPDGNGLLRREVLAARVLVCLGPQ